MPQETKPVEHIEFNFSRADNALKDKMICDSTEEEVKEKLSLIYSMVGLRYQHWPVEQEKKDLHDYLRLKFGKKTLSELVLAFDLAINGELNIKQEDVKVYDQFTILYLAQIMSAYKSWLYKIWQNNKQKPAPLQIEEKKELTDEEKIEWINEWKRDDINFDLIPVPFYDYLIQFKLVEVSKEIKWAAIEKATQQIKSILQVDISNGGGMDAVKAMAEFETGEKNGFTGKLKERILNRAKKLIVAEYLKPTE